MASESSEQQHDIVSLDSIHNHISYYSNSVSKNSNSARISLYHPTLNLLTFSTNFLSNLSPKLSDNIESQSVNSHRKLYVKFYLKSNQPESIETTPKTNVSLVFPLIIDPTLLPTKNSNNETGSSITSIVKEKAIFIPNWAADFQLNNESKKWSAQLESWEIDLLPQASSLHLVCIQILPKFPCLPYSLRNIPELDLKREIFLSLKDIPLKSEQLVRIILAKQEFIFQVFSLQKKDISPEQIDSSLPCIIEINQTDITVSLNRFEKPFGDISINSFNTTSIYDSEQKELLDIIDWILGSRPEFSQVNQSSFQISKASLITGTPGIGKRHFVNSIENIFLYYREDSVLILKIDLGTLLIQAKQKVDPDAFIDIYLKEKQCILANRGDTLAKHHKSTLLILTGLDLLYNFQSNDEITSTLQKKLIETLIHWLKLSKIYLLSICTEPKKLSQELFRLLGDEVKLEFPSSVQRRSLISNWVGSLVIDTDRLVNTTHSYTPADIKFLINTINSFSSDEDLEHTMECLSIKDGPSDIDKALAETAWQRKAGIASQPPNISFEKLGGYNNVKTRLQQLLRLLVQPSLNTLGLARSSGLLLVGPAGCGKTQFAQAMAHHMGFHFISVKGPELFSSNFGGTEKAIRTLFKTARGLSPCTLFIDELDAIGVKRGWSSDDGAGGLTGRVLATLLNELDGVQSKESVFIIACSSFPNCLDDALIRPGRFDTTILVDLPSKQDRKDILQTLLENQFRNISFSLDEKDLLRIVSFTNGFTPADLIWILREASLNLLESGVDTSITLEDILEVIRDRRPSVSSTELSRYDHYRTPL